MYRLLLVFICLGLIQACAVNPVTGKSEFSLVSAEDEVAMGEQHYTSSQQQQGGVYAVDPKINSYLNDVGQRLAAVSDRPKLPYEFVVLNNDVPNAWALPGGKIAINRGLLVLLEDEAQLAAVIGHEIVHAAGRHGAQKMTQQQMMGVGVAAVGIAASSVEYGEYIGMGLMGGAALYQAHYGRSQELESDYHGMKYMVAVGYEPQAAVELQQTFVKLSEGQKSDAFNALFASHPPSEERVKKNREFAKTLPTGERYQERFLKATQQIRVDQPAYAKHQQASQAAAKGEWNNAHKLVAEAIKLQPKEGLFYASQGQFYLAEKKNPEAEASFTKANLYNPNYFLSSLGLGVTLAAQNKNAEAKKALLHSASLMPTQTAYWQLGQLEQKDGNKQQAQQYYQAVVKGGGELGKAAEAKLQELQ